VQPLPLARCFISRYWLVGHTLTIVNVESAARAAEILLVVPTLGRRIPLLRKTLASISEQLIPIDVVVVSPDLPDVHALCLEFGHRWLPDPGSQAEAINRGIDELGDGYFAVGWLNDDDELEPNTAHRVLEELKAKDVVLAYGACRYVDPEGLTLGISRAGRLAPLILPWGPDLIPQPGMLVRSDAWRSLGGLDTTFRLAFDLDFLLRIRRKGGLRYVPCVVSRFMWHPDSLTVDNRELNLVESERARVAALPRKIRWLAPVWEKPAQLAVRMAAYGVSRRARSART